MSHVTSPTPIIAMKDIVKSYMMGEVEVLATRGISLTVQKGEFVAIMGMSRFGQVDTDEYHWMPGRADERSLSSRRREHPSP